VHALVRRWLALGLGVGVTILFAPRVSTAGNADSLVTAIADTSIVETAPPRALTRPELELELDDLRRRREELTARIGDSEPSAKQQEQLDALGVRIAKLEAQIDARAQATAQTVAAEGRSLKARWLRLREAFRDITRYDVKNGMFRLRMGAVPARRHVRLRGRRASSPGRLDRQQRRCSSRAHLRAWALSANV
jgi:hypothetical protein